MSTDDSDVSEFFDLSNVSMVFDDGTVSKLNEQDESPKQETEFFFAVQPKPKRSPNRSPNRKRSNLRGYDISGQSQVDNDHSNDFQNGFSPGVSGPRFAGDLQESGLFGVDDLIKDDPQDDGFGYNRPSTTASSSSSSNPPSSSSLLSKKANSNSTSPNSDSKSSTSSKSIKTVQDVMDDDPLLQAIDTTYKAVDQTVNKVAGVFSSWWSGTEAQDDDSTSDNTPDDSNDTKEPPPPLEDDIITMNGPNGYIYDPKKGVTITRTGDVLSPYHTPTISSSSKIIPEPVAVKQAKSRNLELHIRIGPKKHFVFGLASAVSKVVDLEHSSSFQGFLCQQCGYKFRLLDRTRDPETYSFSDYIHENYVFSTESDELNEERETDQPITGTDLAEMQALQSMMLSQSMENSDVRLLDVNASLTSADFTQHLGSLDTEGANGLESAPMTFCDAIEECLVHSFHLHGSYQDSSRYNEKMRVFLRLVTEHELDTSGQQDNDLEKSVGNDRETENINVHIRGFNACEWLTDDVCDRLASMQSGSSKSSSSRSSSSSSSSSSSAFAFNQVTLKTKTETSAEQQRIKSNSLKAQIEKDFGHWEIGPDSEEFWSSELMGEEYNHVGLQLLGENFSLFPVVRNFGVKLLANLPDRLLDNYLMPLVHSVRFEHTTESPLNLFLFERCCRSTLLSHQLYWILKVCMEDEIYGAFYEQVWDRYLEYLDAHSNDKDITKIFKMQEAFFDEYGSLMDATKGFAAKQQTEHLKTWMKSRIDYFSYFFRKPYLRIPLDPEIAVCKVAYQKCFSSATVPVRMKFAKVDGENENDLYEMMFKRGDDMRNDQLVLRFISLMDEVLKKHGMNLHLTPYRAMALSKNVGILQFMPDSPPLGEIFKMQEEQSQSSTEGENAQSPSKPTPAILTFLKKDNAFDGPGNVFGVHPDTVRLYYESLAGYCAITYLLGVGDRHFDNLLLKKDGHMFHIDFGYIFDANPTIQNYLATPMRLNIQMIDGMGGVEHENYQSFCELTVAAFLVLRKHAELFISLLTLVENGLAEDVPIGTADKMRTKFDLQSTTEEAGDKIVQMIEDCHNNTTAVVIDIKHEWAQILKKKFTF